MDVYCFMRVLNSAIIYGFFVTLFLILKLILHSNREVNFLD